MNVREIFNSIYPDLKILRIYEYGSDKYLVLIDTNEMDPYFLVDTIKRKVFKYTPISDLDGFNNAITKPME